MLGVVLGSFRNRCHARRRAPRACGLSPNLSPNPACGLRGAAPPVHLLCTTPGDLGLINNSFATILYFEHLISLQLHFISRNISIKIRNMQHPVQQQPCSRHKDKPPTQPSDPTPGGGSRAGALQLSHDRAVEPRQRCPGLSPPSVCCSLPSREYLASYGLAAVWLAVPGLNNISLLPKPVGRTLFRSKFRERHSSAHPSYFETNFENY